MAETLSEQVARLERERDEMRKHFNTMSEAARLAEQRIADVTLERDAWKDATARANSRATERVKAMLVRAEKAEAAVRDLERTLADVTRERDSYGALSATQTKVIRELESRLADAERRGAREALTRIEQEMQSPRYAEDIRAFRDREYPAVPPEREGARTERNPLTMTGTELRQAREGCAFVEELAPYRAKYGNHTSDPCDAMMRDWIVDAATRPTPPVEGSRYKCPLSAHGPFCHVECEEAQKLAETAPHLAPRLQVPDARPTPPQAAPDPLLMLPVVDGITSYVHLTPADCQRIVETARRASGREDA